MLSSVRKSPHRTLALFIFGRVWHSCPAVPCRKGTVPFGICRLFSGYGGDLRVIVPDRRSERLRQIAKGTLLRPEAQRGLELFFAENVEYLRPSRLTAVRKIGGKALDYL